jgi:hypothetical protein
MTALLAAISVGAILQAVIVLIILGVIWWLLFWLISFVGLPDPFAKIARVLLGVLAVIVCIAILASLLGHPIVTW